MFIPSFILLPPIENAVFQKSFCKKYVFVSLIFSTLKIVFALQTKLITFHVKIDIIEVRVLKLKIPVREIFSRLCQSYWCQSKLATFLNLCLHELLKKFINRQLKQSWIRNMTKHRCIKSIYSFCISYKESRSTRTCWRGDIRVVKPGRFSGVTSKLPNVFLDTSLGNTFGSRALQKFLATG